MKRSTDGKKSGEKTTEKDVFAENEASVPKKNRINRKMIV